MTADVNSYEAFYENNGRLDRYFIPEKCILLSYRFRILKNILICSELEKNILAIDK